VDAQSGWMETCRVIAESMRRPARRGDMHAMRCVRGARFRTQSDCRGAYECAAPAATTILVIVERSPDSLMIPTGETALFGRGRRDGHGVAFVVGVPMPVAVTQATGKMGHKHEGREYRGRVLHDDRRRIEATCHHFPTGRGRQGDFAAARVVAARRRPSGEGV